MRENTWKRVVSSILCVGLLLSIAGCNAPGQSFGSDEPYVPTKEEQEAWTAEGLLYSGYLYPVMPLTAQMADGTAPDASLQADRSVSVALTDEDVGWGTMIEVEETYALKNTSQTAQSFTVYYPYVDDLLKDESFGFEKALTMQVNGTPVNDRYCALRLENQRQESYVDSYGELKELVPEHGVLPEITQSKQGWADTVLSVYEIIYAPLTVTDKENVDLHITIGGAEKVSDIRVLSNDWRMLSEQHETLTLGYSYEQIEQDPIMILSTEDDLTFTRGRYECLTDNDRWQEECELTVKHQQMSVEQVIEACGEFFASALSYNEHSMDPSVTTEAFQAVLGDALVSWHAKEDLPYIGNVDTFDNFGYQILSEDYYWYLYEDVTLQPGESVTITVKQNKESSYNPLGRERYPSNVEDWFGFEVATSHGSDLHFTKQTATFDLDNGVVVMTDTFLPNPEGEIVLEDEMHYLYYLTKESMRKIITPPGAAAKPVLYLYPEEETQVNVRLNLVGELTSTWPKYQENQGWSVIAKPDGTLIDADGYEYSYLFWEGELKQNWDFSEGFVVAGADAAEFLREKLSYMGLTPKEYNEFIVYWAPILEENAYNLISFQWENYEAAAELLITPQPDHLLRVYMAYQPLDEPMKVPEQELPVLEREGFTVVEWGGCLLEK